ncbi:MAG: tyrosine-protein phosphatase [Cyanobacteria bacterium P01_G01_bin.54]
MALQYKFIKVFESGQLALSERPKIKEIKRLKTDRCDRIVSILSGRGEHAQRLGSEVESQGMQWTWVKVSTANHPSTTEKILLRNASLLVREALQLGEFVLIHCSAGLHRTGILAYCVLRNGGLSHDESLDLMCMMRKKTTLALEDKYLELANQLMLG